MRALAAAAIEHGFSTVRREWRAWSKILFFAIVVRPLVLFLIGLNVHHRHRLPKRGPMILAANHNSHLDTLVLMSLLPLQRLPEVRPLAAADYFMSGPIMAWFSTKLIGIIPIERIRPANAGATPAPEVLPDVLAEAVAALAAGQIVIIYPEGTRGEPEQLQEFKNGIGRLAERCKDAPVLPVFLHGLGKTLPKGSMIPVPFFCDVLVGEPIQWPGDRPVLMQTLRERMAALAAEGSFPPWE